MELLHDLASVGDVEGVRRALASAPERVDDLDGEELTALYRAVEAAEPNPEIVRLLLEAGANPNFYKDEVRLVYLPEVDGWTTEEWMEKASDLSVDDPLAAYKAPKQVRRLLVRAAVRQGDLEVVRTLHAYGADLHYRNEDNFTAIVDAVYGYGDRLPLVRYLIGLGLDVRATASSGDSAILGAYRRLDFSIVAELLRAGADEADLQWSPLHRAIAIGTLADVQEALSRTVNFNVFDVYFQSPLHLALRSGNGAIVDLLERAGANLAQAMANGDPSLTPAVEGGNPNLVARVLAAGISPQDLNEGLKMAVEENQTEMARLILEVGADPNAPQDYFPLIQSAADREMILLLHEFGADLNGLNNEGRRTLLGLGENDLSGVSQNDYLAGRYPEEGTSNPQDIGGPFRLAMIRAGWWAYGAREHFGDSAFGDIDSGEEESEDESETIVELTEEEEEEGAACTLHFGPPVWCFCRFGQSTTILPDGRIVLIAGEHEDYYDPDFCIYNDVAVFSPDGSITLYGYPFDVFPPTDFHTATLVGDWIYIVGSLGYTGSREGPIPVRRLSLRDFHIELVETTGDVPNRIFQHRARLVDGALEITGGTKILFSDETESHEPNSDTVRLDLRTLTWSRIEKT